MIKQEITWYTLDEKKPDPRENQDVRINMGGSKNYILCLVIQKGGVGIPSLWLVSDEIFIGLGPNRPLDMKAIDMWCYFPMHPVNNILDKYENEFKLDPTRGD